jgi:hypothetical protein
MASNRVNALSLIQHELTNHWFNWDAMSPGDTTPLWPHLPDMIKTWLSIDPHLEAREVYWIPDMTGEHGARRHVRVSNERDTYFINHYDRITPPLVTLKAGLWSRIRTLVTFGSVCTHWHQMIIWPLVCRTLVDIKADIRGCWLGNAFPERTVPIPVEFLPLNYARLLCIYWFKTHCVEKNVPREIQRALRCGYRQTLEAHERHRLRTNGPRRSSRKRTREERA